MLRRLFAFFALIGIVAAAACNDDAVSTLIAPITGIEIRSEALTAGRGCGTTPPQVYKYVALVYGSGNTDGGIVDPNTDLTAPVAIGVFDCFTDGAFVQLPATNGSFQFRLELYAYVAPAYERARPSIEAITKRIAQTNAVKFELADAVTLEQTNATYRTKCFATQQDLVEVLAVCDPLTSADGGGSTVVQIPTTSFARADGTSITCDPGPGGVVVEPPTPDAGEDADAGDAAVADAGDAASDAGADAGPAKTYKTVRVRTRIDQKQVGSQVDLACPTAFILSPAEPLTKYTFDVGLLDEAGNTVGLTTCTAAAEPGSASTATCNPVP